MMHHTLRVSVAGGIDPKEASKCSTTRGLAGLMKRLQWINLRRPHLTVSIENHAPPRARSFPTRANASHRTDSTE